MSFCLISLWTLLILLRVWLVASISSPGDEYVEGRAHVLFIPVLSIVLGKELINLTLVLLLIHTKLFAKLRIIKV